jgi:hypothetical protein
MPARRVLGDQLAASLPAPKRRNRHAQRFRRFAYAYKSIHNG